MTETSRAYSRISLLSGQLLWILSLPFIKISYRERLKVYTLDLTASIMQWHLVKSMQQSETSGKCSAKLCLRMGFYQHINEWESWDNDGIKQSKSFRYLCDCQTYLFSITNISVHKVMLGFMTRTWQYSDMRLRLVKPPLIVLVKAS